MLDSAIVAHADARTRSPRLASMTRTVTLSNLRQASRPRRRVQYCLWMISSDGPNLCAIALESFNFGIPNIQPRGSALTRQRGYAAQ